MNTTHHHTSDNRHDDLEGLEARRKIRELVEATANCFFVTRTSYPGSTNARPMAVQEIDDQGNLWFVSSKETLKIGNCRTTRRFICISNLLVAASFWKFLVVLRLAKTRNA